MTFNLKPLRLNHSVKSPGSELTQKKGVKIIMPDPFLGQTDPKFLLEMSDTDPL